MKQRLTRACRRALLERLVHLRRRLSRLRRDAVAQRPCAMVFQPLPLPPGPGQQFPALQWAAPAMPLTVLAVSVTHLHQAICTSRRATTM